MIQLDFSCYNNIIDVYTILFEDFCLKHFCYIYESTRIYQYLYNQLFRYLIYNMRKMWLLNQKHFQCASVQCSIYSFTNINYHFNQNYDAHNYSLYIRKYYINLNKINCSDTLPLLPISEQLVLIRLAVYMWSETL